MTIFLFNEKYGRIGGVDKLKEFMSSLHSHKYIADYFGVNPKRIRQWSQELFGYSYDPREERKNMVINNMVEMAKNIPLEAFKKTFRRTEYYKIALKKCKDIKIYERID